MQLWFLFVIHMTYMYMIPGAYAMKSKYSDDLRYCFRLTGIQQADRDTAVYGTSKIDPGFKSPYL